MDFFVQSTSFEATDEIAYFAYDAVLAVAHGLHQSNESNLHLFDPVNTSTENRDIGEAIRNSIEDVDFNGFSVRCIRKCLMNIL